MQQKIVPDIIAQPNITAVSPDDTVFSAAEKMLAAHIAALVVIKKGDTLVGIITERDITQRLVAKGLDPKNTPVSDIMTTNPDTLSPNDSAGDALNLMQSRNYRHLPVAEGKKCVGIVSIRDLYAAVMQTLEEDIKEKEAFVFGDRYGA
ncbi:MAG: Hypoxic response protein 1 [Alphaproteobacteria bacterium MarineAlpha3_Bin5]|nr:CBS domain-containing protein [Magnetovibrio sp.]PPR78496.1 MAG: Hypoxic response protein 1 [Alphaproteobacteria bacterium MarineAlpha3_Bin5]